MDPQLNQSPGLRLPQPSVNSGGYSSMPQAQFGQAQTPPQYTAEQPAPAPQFSAVQQSQMTVQAPTPIMTAPQAQKASQTAPQQAPIASSAPSTPVTTISEDSEASDEVWTTKVRAIAEQYRADPYMQSKAIAKLKAEYLQSRHSKVVKVDEN